MSNESETGWSREWPHKSDAGDEYYFARRVDRKDVVVMGFSMGKAWLNGVAYEPSEMRSHLFLGPLKPADFQQLVRLREAGTAALRAINGVVGWLNVSSAYRNRDDLDPKNSLLESAAALRNALGTQEGEPTR